MVKVTKWPSSDRSQGTAITQMTMADMATCGDQSLGDGFMHIIHLPHSPQRGLLHPPGLRWGNGDTERLSHSRAGTWTQAAVIPNPFFSL